MSVERRREMVGRERHKLSLSRRCRLLGISRGSLYYRPRGESPEILSQMRRIDEQYLKTPWYGARQMARTLRRQGHPVGRKRVGRLMRLMQLRSRDIAARANTSPATVRKRIRAMEAAGFSPAHTFRAVILPMLHTGRGSASESGKAIPVWHNRASASQISSMCRER